MSRRKKNPYVVMFSLYRRYTTNKKKAIWFMTLQFLSRMVLLSYPFLFAQMLNSIQDGGPTMWTNILPYALLLLF